MGTVESKHDTTQVQGVSLEPNDSSYSKVVWHPREKFEPGLIGRLVGEKTQPINHRLFGKGFTWGLTSRKEVAPKLEFFPLNRVVRIKLPNSPTSPTDFETHDYPPVESINVQSFDNTIALIILCSEQEGRNSTLFVYPASGQIFEWHSFHKLSGGRLPDAGVLFAALNLITPPPEPTEARTYTVTEAAARLGIPRATLSARLNRNRLNGAFKRGRQWFIPSEALERYQPGKPGRPRITSFHEN